jgi:hypothetical protein
MLNLVSVLSLTTYYNRGLLLKIMLKSWIEQKVHCQETIYACHIVKNVPKLTGALYFKNYWYVEVSKKSEKYVHIGNDV